MFRSVLDRLLQESPDRETYKNEKEAFLAQIAYSIGLGNFWRFPYLCYLHGGATFVIAYGVCMLCVGLPLYLLELSLGQYVGLGPTHIFSYLCPILGGLGWGMMLIRIMISVYYNVILSWSLFYAGASFSSPLPWSHCRDVEEVGDCSRHSVDVSFVSARDYFLNEVLGQPEEDESPYELHGWLVLCLGLSWVLVCICLLQGIRHTGKILYVTVIYPYVVLICIFGMNLDRISSIAKEQWLANLTNVDFDKLLVADTWCDAASQVIYSLGVGFGGVAMVASHNKLTQNVIRDSVIMCMLDVFTSLLCGNVLFSLAVTLSPEMIEENNGLTPLVFTLVSAMLARINLPIWPFLFFTMIFALGFDSLLLMVEAITTTLLDQFSALRRCHLLVIGSSCCTFFLLGLSMCTRSGIYVVELMNDYTAKHSLLFMAFLEVVIASYAYGHQKVFQFIRDYFKVRVPAPFAWYLSASWLVITPLCLLLLCGSMLYTEEWVKETESLLHLLCRQAIAFAPVLPIPIFALYVYCTKGDKSLKDLVTVTPNFMTAKFRRAERPPDPAKQDMAFKNYGFYIDHENWM